LRKDKFETKPELEIKNVNSKNLRQGQDLVVTLEFRDKEGDVDSILYVVRERTNRLGRKNSDRIIMLYLISLIKKAGKSRLPLVMPTV
jgi:hypothetical protein